MKLACVDGPDHKERVGNLPWGAIAAFASMLFCGLYLFARYDSKYTLLLSGVCAIVVAAVVFSYQMSKKGAIDSLVPFAIALVASGLIYMLVYAPGTVPDEIYHFNSSYKYSDVILGEEVSDTSIAMRGDDIEFENNVLFDFEVQPHLDRSLYRNTVLESSLLASDTSYSQFEVDNAYSISSDLPQLKLPSAIGIVIAKLLNLGSVPLFYLGRLFNFAYFCVLVFLAIRITPIGKNIFMVVALLPMTLHVAASYSYDAGTIGLSFLFCALAFKAMVNEGAMSRGELIRLGVVALLLSPCKVVYVLMLVLLLFIPSSRFGSRKLAFRYKAGLIVMGFVFIAILRLPSLLGTIGGVGLDEASSQTVSERYSIAGLLADPVYFALLILRTFDALGDFYLLSMIGQQPGWFQGELYAPYYAVLPLFILLVLASFKSSEDDIVLPIRVRIVLLITFVVTSLALVFSAIGWTAEGASIIEGVQGRYFLPLLPFLCLAFRGNSVEVKKSIVPSIVSVESFCSLFIVLRVFAIALTL